jgi:hypothetical protein
VLVLESVVLSHSSRYRIWEVGVSCFEQKKLLQNSIACHSNKGKSVFTMIWLAHFSMLLYRNLDIKKCFPDSWSQISFLKKKTLKKYKQKAWISKYSKEKSHQFPQLLNEYIFIFEHQKLTTEVIIRLLSFFSIFFLFIQFTWIKF